MASVKLKGWFWNKKIIFEGADATKLALGLNREVQNEILATIEGGNSPVRGGRKFPKYKNPSKYPGKEKPAQPVNLVKTGEMLSRTKFFTREKGIFNKALRLYFGIEDGASEAVKNRAEGNNMGRNGIPRRQFIPLRGQEFNNRISTMIKSVIRNYLKDYIRSLKK